MSKNKDNNRYKRVEKEIKKKIAIILQNYINNTHLSMITVSAVKISNDLSYAKVFVTFLQDSSAEEIKNKINKLQLASSFIRKILSKSIKLRVLPKIMFYYDSSMLEGRKITNIIKKLF